MKFIHLADLHLGKRLNDFSLMEDQEYILKEILQIIEKENPDGVIIAGDIYDKAVPAAESVKMFDDFLVALAAMGHQVFIISGNHDSPERLAFANRLIDASGVHIAPVYNGKVSSYTLTDQYGPVNVYLLPFIKPANIRAIDPEAQVTTYTEAIQYVLKDLAIDETQRNVLITHQFITGARRTDSEEVNVGGVDNIDSAVFKAFDYVALGHLHSSQIMGPTVAYYSGSPLKYSFSEADDEKSVSVVELFKKGVFKIRMEPLKPLHDMVEIKGTYDELTALSYYENNDLRNSYLHVTLTDQQDVNDALGKLRVIYPLIMKLDYDNDRTKHTESISGADSVDNRKPLDLVSDLYSQQNNNPLNEQQKEYVTAAIHKIWGDEQ